MGRCSIGLPPVPSSLSHPPQTSGSNVSEKDTLFFEKQSGCSGAVTSVTRLALNDTLFLEKQLSCRPQASPCRWNEEFLQDWPLTGVAGLWELWRMLRSGFLSGALGLWAFGLRVRQRERGAGGLELTEEHAISRQPASRDSCRSRIRYEHE